MEGSWKGGSVFSLRAASQQCGQFRLVSFKLPLQILLQQLLAFTGHRVSEVTGDIQYAVSSGIEGKKVDKQDTESLSSASTRALLLLVFYLLEFIMRFYF